RVLANGLHNLRDLINRPPIRRAPIAPLRAVNTSEISLCVCPFIPNGHSIFPKVADVGFAAEEPEEFVKNRASVKLLRREQRKSLGEIVADLRTKNGISTRAGPIGLVLAVVEHVTEQIEVGLHVHMVGKVSSS